MKREEMEYICRNVGSMSGLPIRLYRGDRLIYTFSRTPLDEDPVSLVLKDLLQLKDHVSYFITKDFFYYGTCRRKNFLLVLGPGRQSPLSRKELKRLAFDLSVPQKEEEAFFTQMKALTAMPFDILLQIMCTLNYAVNREMLSVADITIVDEDQLTLDRGMTETSWKEAALPQNDLTEGDYLLNYQVENQLNEYIRKGDTDGLQKWMEQLPAIRAGIQTPDALRQQKDLLIVSATTMSRAAIHGGMPVDDAFHLSDAYIKKAEQLSDPVQLTNLMRHMALNYAREVEELRYEEGKSDFTRNVIRYIRHHLSEPVKTQDIADALYMSRSRLSTRFHEEMGLSLTDYIRAMKITEAKHLLRNTDKNLSAIASYLGFSSQSHFCRVFHQETGMAPTEYRKSRSETYSTVHV